MSDFARFAGQISVDGMFGDASGYLGGVAFPDGTIGDASGNFVGHLRRVPLAQH